MRIKWIIGIISIIMLGGAGAVYAYANSLPQNILPHSSIAGINLSNNTPQEAKAKIQRYWQAAQKRTVNIRVITPKGDRTFTLTQRDLHASTTAFKQLAALEQQAQTASKFDRLLGNGSGKQYQPRTVIDRRLLKKKLRSIERRYHKQGTDATLTLTSDGPKVTPSAAGQQLQINTATVSRHVGNNETVVVKTTKVEPAVTTAAARRSNKIFLLVHKSQHKLWLYKGTHLWKTYPVATGMPGHDTPEGLFDIQDKQVDPVWNVPNSPWAGELAGSSIPAGAANPLKARWMGVTNGVGFHGTAEDASVGTSASHGCMRMHVKDIIDLYPRVPVGSPVMITP